MASENELKGTIEGMYVIGTSALRSIRMMAELALHECDRGPGKLSANLVILALEEISFRAADAENCLGADGESQGVGDGAGMLRRLSRAAALEGRVWP